jgi:hypothetical protein
LTMRVKNLTQELALLSNRVEGVGAAESGAPGGRPAAQGDSGTRAANSASPAANDGDAPER